MDNSLPSYEAAMREARAYLRRRDLSSQDEIPLYFAWQRLYAAANANLSTDFLRETTSELRARQDARLEPRRGIPPPLFTSFDKVNRTSAQASAFLRTGTSSQAAIEMMARRYRRDAEKLRLSREKSMDFTRKLVKKGKKRQKTPQEEVDELLESLEGLSDDENLLATTKGGNRQQKRHAAFEDEDVDSLDSLGNPQISKKHAFTVKNKLGAGGYVGGIGVAVNPVKAAKLRRSSSAVAPLGNVAAFAAQVDWRMPPDIDRASSAPELSQKGKRLSGANELRGPGLLQKGASLKSTVSGGRLSGGNELREPGLTEVEGDMTLNSSGSSEVDEDNFDPNATFNVDAARVSPTANRSIAKDKRNFSSRQVRLSSDERDEMTRTGREQPMSIQPSRSTISEFQQKLVQLSRAVGDMEVKIHGKKVEVTFHGELNEEDSTKAVASPIKAAETKHPSTDKKTFDTTGRDSVKDVGQETNEKNATQGRSSKDWSQEKTQTNVPRKQSNVRFADTARSDDDNRADTTGSRQQQMREASAGIPSVQAAEQSPQLRSSASGGAFNSNVAAEAVLGEESEEETKEEKPIGRIGQSVKERHEGEQVHKTDSVDEFGSHNLRQQIDEEGQQERSDEENEDGGVTEDEDSHNERPDSRHVSQRRAGTEYQDARTDRSRSETQKSRSGIQHLQHQTVYEEHHNRDGMDDDRSSIGERQTDSQRGRRAEAEYQEYPAGRDRSGTQESRSRSRDSFESRKIQHQMDEEGQSIYKGGDSSGGRPDSRHSSSRRDRIAEPAPHTDQNSDAAKISRPSSRKSQHQVAEEGRHNRSDEVRMDDNGGSIEAVSQRDRRVEVEFQDARTDRSRSGTQKSSHDSLGSHKLQHQMGQGMGEDKSSIDEHQDSRHLTSQCDRGTKVAHQDVHTDRSKSVVQQLRPQSRDSERDPTNERDDRSIKELDKVNVDQNTRPNRDQLQRQSSAAREHNLNSTARVSQSEVDFERSHRSDTAHERNLDVTERLAQQNVEFDQQSFSDASEDESEGQTSNEQEENSERGSLSEDQRSSSHSGSSTRASSVHESIHEDRERLQTPRQSHNQSEEVSVNSVSSDEEFSDGPDTPFKQHKQHHRVSSRQVSKIQHEKMEKRRSSSKRKKYPPEFSGNSETSTSRDNSSSDKIYRSRSHHSTRSSDRAQSRYSARKSSRHLPPAMVSHPRRSRDHTNSESKSRKTTWTLPKGIVWPPGMEEECVARLGLNGHHPIAPPGLEHLVTEEQWGEYWTWLHWYSSWQMWYMKNDKKPKKKTDKEKRRHRDDSPDHRQNPRNSNWWVDAGSSKHRHRRERHD